MLEVKVRSLRATIATPNPRHRPLTADKIGFGKWIKASLRDLKKVKIWR